MLDINVLYSVNEAYIDTVKMNGNGKVTQRRVTKHQLTEKEIIEKLAGGYIIMHSYGTAYLYYHYTASKDIRERQLEKLIAKKVVIKAGVSGIYTTYKYNTEYKSPEVIKVAGVVLKEAGKNIGYLNRAEWYAAEGRKGKEKEFNERAYAATKRAESALYKLDISSARQAYELSGIEAKYTCCPFEEFVNVENFIC